MVVLYKGRYFIIDLFSILEPLNRLEHKRRTLLQKSRLLPRLDRQKGLKDGIDGNRFSLTVALNRPLDPTSIPTSRIEPILTRRIN
jgi:hypothetical protein